MKNNIAIVLGVLFVLYFICIEFFTGHGTNFYFIWLIMGLGLLLFAFCSKMGMLDTLPLWIRRSASIFFILGMLVFLFVESLIIGGFGAKGEKDLDYLIVLGAQLKVSGPSKVLRMRLDTAYDYLLENEDTKVIVSGGQGSDEPDTEAQGMFDYLVKRGIESQRIIKEDKSTNTTQNISFSSRYLNKEEDSVGIVTNNFHVYRATAIARANGYADVCGVAAPADPFLQANNMLREFFGVVKDSVFGNM
ncbi:MAG: YdcF family protein [Lachnospiraceae bacterium]|nr:YdcF family protein [Lachnospiraceae bacterium]